jgi:hypothetical protein
LKREQAEIFFSGRETKRAQLLGTPQRLQMPDSAREKEIHLKKKKAKNKNTTK